MKPGQPCDHPGCADSRVYPCDGCGRYAAGTRNGPDVESAQEHIIRLAMENPTLCNAYRLGEEERWTWPQTLTFMVIALANETDFLREQLLDFESRRRYIQVIP